jgi:hypothetical protein
MKTSRTRILCLLAAALSALSGLIPTADLAYKVSHWEARDQADEAYLSAHILEAVIYAIAGFAVAYILFRAGARPKSATHTESMQPPHPDPE